MATLKLNKHPASGSADKRRDDPAQRGPRAPVRGAGSAPRARPTLAEAQGQRAEREALYQEQLRQRFGSSPPAAFNRSAPPDPRGRPDPRGVRTAVPEERAPRNEARSDPRNDRQRAPQRDAWPAHQQNRGAPPRQSPQPDPTGRNTAFDPRRSQGPQPQQQQQRPPQRPQRPQQRQDFRDRDDDDGNAVPVEVPGSMRLSKRMSELGIASRREADEWIPKGWVRVDGRVVSELGSRVLPSQQITVDAKAKFVQAQKVTVILNKPIGYVSGQAEDGYEPAVVLVKPANQWREDQSGTRYLLTHLRGIAPAGRLDIDSIGLLVLTQDGRIAKQLIGEDSEMEKEYLVRVQTLEGGGLSDAGLALLNHGLELDGEPLREARVEWINDDQLRFVLKEGKKRQIRRMCEAVGLKVVGLKRVRIGGVMLGDLPVGQWRYLRGDESFVPLKPPTAE